MASNSVGPQPLTQDEIDEKLRQFDSVPLFMKELPDDGTDDVALAALQNLAYEGTPDEVAQNFKEQGNDYFKGKRYREALGFYTQGVDANPTDKAILEVLLCNRAACNLELKNYGSVLRDCSRALTLNVQSSKAYYRSALALLALEKTGEALDCCDRCLIFDSNNSGVKSVRERVMKAKEIKDKKKRETEERLRREAEAKQKMDLVFKERNLIAVKKADGSSNPYEPHFDPEDPTGSTLVFPVFFLYPQYATSDVIEKFSEDTPFNDHLSAMFPPQAPPPDWDRNSQYFDGNLVIYAMTRRKRLLKIGKKMTLRDVCKAAKAKEGEPRDGIEVKDGCLTFAVLPKGDVETKWVDDYKKARDS